MGLKLSLDSGVRKVPLRAGASLMMRPASSVDANAAEATAARKLKAALDGADALADIGISVPTAEDLEDADYVSGLLTYLLACALAARLVTGWEGILDEAGNKIPFSVDLLPHLLRSNAELRAFNAGAYSRLAVLDQEGKGSAPSSNGSHSGARTTAKAAGRKTSPAAGASRAKTGSSARNAKAPKRRKA